MNRRRSDKTAHQLVTYLVILIITGLLSVNHREVAEHLGDFVDHVVFDSPEQAELYKRGSHD